MAEVEEVEQELEHEVLEEKKREARSWKKARNKGTRRSR